ncbi:hypothetical protein IQ235_02960 [Oscillatoriales cyanobacterium LEGE 11467]|uniref:Uncharacterized protein n=1 Tax=Zarconia navalis LEGE 11467 TaxID=1828826 RepID=A0A928VW03_9CYAN|nr:hypothetical protein [Zarconia navalis]MBE9039752.1 hypothetical protein [Zarconia navalis LEGE 11467]
MSTFWKSQIAKVRQGLRRLVRIQPFRALIRISYDFYQAQAILSDRPLMKPHPTRSPQKQHS